MLTYGDQSERTLLLVFSESCGVCAINWPKWQSIARSIDAHAARLVYVNVSPRLGDDFINRYGLSGSAVLAQIEPKTRLAYNLRLTPETILIGANGKIEHVWVGLLDQQQLFELQYALGVHGLVARLSRPHMSSLPLAPGFPMNSAYSRIFTNEKGE